MQVHDHTPYLQHEVKLKMQVHDHTPYSQHEVQLKIQVHDHTPHLQHEVKLKMQVLDHTPYSQQKVESMPARKARSAVSNEGSHSSVKQGQGVVLVGFHSLQNSPTFKTYGTCASRQTQLWSFA